MTEEQRQLVADNHDLIYGFLRKYGFDDDEYYDLAAIGLCKAAEKWNPRRGAFSTYAYRTMINIITTDIQYKNRGKRIPENLIISYNTEICNDANGSIVEFLDYIPSDDDVERDAIDRVVIKRYLSKLSDLSDRDRLVFFMLIDEYSMQEIAKRIGCCRQNIMLIKRKIVRRLMRERIKLW